MKLKKKNKNEIIASLCDNLNVTKSHIRKKIDGKMETVYYYNVVVAFDIETTSYINKQGEKRATMYIWQLSFNGEIILGRTWEEFVTVINTISEKLCCNYYNRVAVYVHNLSYEFGFLLKQFQWENVFALDTRKPVRCLTTNGIEFRCSYILTTLALKYIPKQIQNEKLRVYKKEGDLDYNIMRNSKTILTDEELEYCINDVKIIHGYITEKMEEDGGIAKIKLTNTSYVRDYVRTRCLPNKIEHITDEIPTTKERKDELKKLVKNCWHKYKNIMSSLYITPAEYIQLKEAFGGGYTHASAHSVFMTLYKVKSYDFSSSYPAVMLAEKFPMSSGKLSTITTIEELQKEMKKDKCAVLTITFNDIELKDNIYDCYISESKCSKITSDKILDNGRVYYAHSLTTTITNVDLDIITQTYDFKSAVISNCYVYRTAYLPRPIIDSILHFYGGKTELKDEIGKEVEYTRLKGMLNSTYGMMVTDIVRDEIEYDEIRGWTKTTPTLAEKIDKYNTSQSRFLFYPWGVFVTAYARRNLWSGIINIGEDYHYSDTDSIKVTNIEKHIDYINSYNEEVKEKLTKMCDYYKIDTKLLHPKNVKEVEKWIGIWDDDGTYTHFKTLGAKRYLVRGRNKETGEMEIKMTVAGVAKKAVDYLIKQNDNDVDKIFDSFNENLCFPRGECGKSTHSYSDEGFTEAMTDYQGNTTIQTEKSFIHLEECGYDMKVPDKYIQFLEFYSTERTEEIM